jgi:hypothetical protein
MAHCIRGAWSMFFAHDVGYNDVSYLIVYHGASSHGGARPGASKRRERQHEP